MIANLPFIAVALLIGIAFAMILLKRNMIKMVMGLGILEEQSTCSWSRSVTVRTVLHRSLPVLRPTRPWLCRPFRH